MDKQKSWGIFKGFNPPSAEARWCTPVCPRCVNTPQTVLCPWIDWWSIGTIGYCQHCTRFFHVSSEWEQIPGTHSKAERDQLVSHEVVEIEFGNTCVIETAKVWAWHEALPGDRDMLDDIDAARKRIPMESVEAVLLSYMLWTILWNVNAPSAHLLEDFFEFGLRHPQYLQYRSKPVWLGHEVQLAESLERRYPDEVVQALHAVWMEHQPTDAIFKAGLGFFIPKSSSTQQRFGAAFASAASNARKRL